MYMYMYIHTYMYVHVQVHVYVQDFHSSPFLILHFYLLPPYPPCSTSFLLSSFVFLLSLSLLPDSPSLPHLTGESQSSGA